MIGHPEHELLFVAKQVADAAGLRNGSSAVYELQKYRLAKLVRVSEMSMAVQETLRHSRSIQLKSWLISEADTYTMIMRGHAPQSEPFRKWVTDEVLPSIRKTGSSDLAKSNTPKANQVSEDFCRR
ncbi:hypothetical protein IDH70_11745 [Mixta calida]|nr:hypothetical protein IDH70_11745 [Mixta calida]